MHNSFEGFDEFSSFLLINPFDDSNIDYFLFQIMSSFCVSRQSTDDMDLCQSMFDVIWMSISFSKNGRFITAYFDHTMGGVIKFV